MAIVCGFACGPKPYQETPLLDGHGLGDAFDAEYGSIKSLVVKLEAGLGSDLSREFELTAAYLYPDSFAFLAEGVFGADLARGALCGDSGFWEFPRRNESCRISRFDKIIIGDSLPAISIGSLARVLFFFAGTTLAGDRQSTGNEIVITAADGPITRRYCFESRTGRLLFQYLLGADSLVASYHSWRRFSSVRLPATIRLFDYSRSEFAGLKIKKASSNRRIPRSMFLSVNQ